MFIKTTLYFEIQGPVTQAEVLELQTKLGIELTRAIERRMTEWTDWSMKTTDGRILKAGIRTANVVQKSLGKVPPTVPTPSGTPPRVGIIEALKRAKD